MAQMRDRSVSYRGSSIRSYAQLEEVVIYLSSEEILKDKKILDIIKEYRARFKMDISFMTKETEYIKGTAELRKLLRENSGEIKEEDVDGRAEGNCVCTGCKSGISFYMENGDHVVIFKARCIFRKSILKYV